MRASTSCSLSRMRSIWSSPTGCSGGACSRASTQSLRRSRSSQPTTVRAEPVGASDAPPVSRSLMSEIDPATADQAAFRDELLARGLFLETGVAGLYGRGAVFEDIRRRFDTLVTSAAAPDHPESMRFPPLLPRRVLESSGYLHSFPHLAGSVFAFDGGESDAVEQA